MDAANFRSIKLSAADHSELLSLREWLSWVPDLKISQIAGEPGTGEQGALDVLTVVASSSTLIAAVRVLPEFLRSRRTSLSITVKVGDDEFAIEANNVEDVMPILERLLDD